MALGRLAVFCALAAVLMMAGCVGGPSGNQTASCGNKVLDAGEQCEAGTPCQNSSLVCNSDCRCVPPAQAAKANISCAMNAGRVNNGSFNTFNPAAMACRDDCKAFDPNSVCDPASCTCTSSCAAGGMKAAVAGALNQTNSTFNSTYSVCKDDCKALSPAAVCDAKTCSCKLPPPPVPVGCAWNSLLTSFLGKNPFNPATMACRDDCALANPNLKCDATCNCVPKKPQVSCAVNTNGVNAGKPNGFNAAANICKDDCKAADPLSACDPKTCTCRKASPPSCIANSIMTALSGSNKFNPLGGLACKDDCKAFDKDLSCDPVKCLCGYPQNRTNKTLPCATNTIFEKDGAGSVYDPAVYSCEDNCKELDPALSCDAATCTCKKSENQSFGLSCAQHTVPGQTTREKVPSWYQCKDDCATLGSGYTCDALSCTCVPPGTYPTYSCYNNSIDIAYGGGTAYPLPASYRCEDDCDKNEPGLVCDPVRCVCKPKVNVTEGTTSCAVNSFDRDYYNISSYKPGMACRDDCKEYDQSMYCDGSTCTCQLLPEENRTMSCSGNSIYSDYTGANGFNPSEFRCEDDCAKLGDGLACDPKTCACKKDSSLSCSGNSFLFGMTGGFDGGAEPQSAFQEGMQCKDDCSRFDDGLVCDPASCLCEKPGAPPPQISCASRAAAGATLEALPRGVMCKDDCASLGSGYTCDGASCTCKPPAVTENITNQTPGRCGDGVTTYPEQCDLGSYMTNKCPQGKYCTKDCACKTIENTPVCGDGKISSPGEDCDNGNVATSVCQGGYSCKLCKCVPSTSIAQCGDGTVTPPEECDPGNSYTAMCPNGNLCNSCKCSTPTGTAAQQHNVCDYAHGACVTVNGTGTNECTSDSQCTQAAPQYHNVCSGGKCVSAAGVGTDQCSSDSQCTQTAPQTHTECDFTHGACVTVNGSGASTCGSNSDCVPPVLDCPAYCSSQGFSQSLGSGYTSSDQCKAAAAESAVQCTTTCIYTSFYSVSNQAGTTTCCCKAKYTYSCTNCPAAPGTQPYCPQCPSAKPG